NLGIIPGYGATQRLPRLVGAARAFELILSANMIGAAEAERIGLVNRVYPPDQLMDETEKFVKLILSKGPIAVQAAIKCINASMYMSPMEGLEYESNIFGEVCGTEDFKEGTKAFLEKRQPEFRDK
ncbi:MAG: enoyl-CoA hydratase/isomerase family protein, partial [Candidatus Kapaibacterium sp.]